MKSTDITDALHRRFDPKQYVCLLEAPRSPDRNGAIDFVAISCWKSRHYAIDAIEVKVTYADWKNERHLRDGEWVGTYKNFWWAQHAHRFWIACPKSIADRIEPELPFGWGLIAVDDETGAAFDRKKAHRKTPEPIAWPNVVGLMRSQQGAGWSPMDRARRGGWESATDYLTMRFERMTPEEFATWQAQRVKKLADDLGHSLAEVVTYS